MNRYTASVPIVVLAIFASLLLAQPSPDRLTIVVEDASGAPIPGASVLVQHWAGGQLIQDSVASTDTQGRASSRLDPEVVYHVFASAPGFLPAAAPVGNYGDTQHIFKLAIMTGGGVRVSAQTPAEASPSVTSKSATLSLSIAVPNEQIPLKQKPWVHLTVTNLGSKEIPCPFSRVYVEGSKGEPPTTLWQRQLTYRTKPGETGIKFGGYRPPIAPAGWPGDSFIMKYDLSAYYDFKEPGKYTVYIEVLDESGTMANPWVRSPVAAFELVAPARKKE